MNALAGYQLIESVLKFYADTYYKAVRGFLDGKLHFDYHGKDVESAPLGRLISGFSKTCGNKQLVADLRKLLSHRDQIAHQGLLCLYDQDTSEETFHKMIKENHACTDELTRLLKEVLAEVDRVGLLWKKNYLRQKTDETDGE